MFLGFSVIFVVLSLAAHLERKHVKSLRAESEVKFMDMVASSARLKHVNVIYNSGRDSSDARAILRECGRDQE